MERITEYLSSNGQFDCVIKRKEGFNFYECKYYEKPMTMDECEAEASQVKELVGITANRIGFICSGGFETPDKKYELITGDDLFRI